jgi:hypothetical protein
MKTSTLIAIGSLVTNSADARCAGAGRTNCSVGVSKEFIQEIEAQRQWDNTAMIGAFITVVLLAIAGVAWVFWDECHYRRNR